MEALGVVAGGHDECGRGVRTDAEEAQQIGDGGDEEGFDPGVKLGKFSLEQLDAMRQRGQ